MSVKALKRALKKAGLKTSGRKSTLTKRAKKAHLKLRGGALVCPPGWKVAEENGKKVCHNDGGSMSPDEPAPEPYEEGSENDPEVQVRERFSSKGGRRGVSVKTLKRALKKAGLKTSGRKAALTRRAKKAHLKLRGGADGICYDKQGYVVEDVTEDACKNDGNDWQPKPGLANESSAMEVEDEPVDGGRHRRGHRSRRH